MRAQEFQIVFADAKQKYEAQRKAEEEERRKRVEEERRRIAEIEQKRLAEEAQREAQRQAEEARKKVLAARTYIMLDSNYVMLRGYRWIRCVLRIQHGNYFTIRYHSSDFPFKWFVEYDSKKGAVYTQTDTGRREKHLFGLFSAPVIDYNTYVRSWQEWEQSRGGLDLKAVPIGSDFQIKVFFRPCP